MILTDLLLEGEHSQQAKQAFNILCEVGGGGEGLQGHRGLSALLGHSAPFLFVF